METELLAQSGITDEAVLKEILESARTVAIIGWSDKEDRASHEVGKYLVRHGYDVIGVNPRLAGKRGPQDEVVYASALEIPRPVNIVDVFRRPEFTPIVAEHAVAIGAGTLWMQIRVINEESGDIASQGGVQFVQDRCTKIDHMRLIRGIPIPANW